MSELTERLREAAMQNMRDAWSRNDAHCLGIGANLAEEAADVLDAKDAEIAQLRADVATLPAWKAEIARLEQDKAWIAMRNKGLKIVMDALKARITGLEKQLGIVRFDPPLRGQPIEDCAVTTISQKFPWKPSTDAETPNG